MLKIVEEIIFKNGNAEENTEKNEWLELYGMSDGFNDEKEIAYCNYRFGEWALCSLSLYPIEPNEQFIGNCIQVKLQKNYKIK